MCVCISDILDSMQNPTPNFDLFNLDKKSDFRSGVTKIGEGESTDLYAVTMTDPDAPSRKDPTNADWLHWMVVDIKGLPNSEQIKSQNLGGKMMIPYEGPSPPKGSGEHRYFTTIWKQSAPFNATNAPKQRHKFNTSEFARANNWSNIDENVQTVSG